MSAKRHQAARDVAQEVPEAFSWSALDVPLRISQPVLERITLPKARSMHPEEWFDGAATPRNSGGGGPG
jgi:hypothetical protein